MERHEVSVLVQDIAVAIGCELLKVLKNKRKRKREWVRSSFRRDDVGQPGTSNALLKEPVIEDVPSCTNFLRISVEQFNYLLNLVTPLIQKQDTNYRDAIRAKVKLEVTLRYLAKGDSYAALESMYRVPKPSLCVFVEEVCKAIYTVLQDFIQLPTTNEQWQEIGLNFRNQWKFPGCYGAIDGRNLIKSPGGGIGKSTSINLLALVDHDYCFRYIDIGESGKCSDDGIFANCTLNTAFQSNTLNIPDDGFLVGEHAFPLSMYVMKPYSGNLLTKEQKIFNFRLLRACRVVENAFGVMAANFQVLTKPMTLAYWKLGSIVKATCALHNWLRMTSRDSYMPPGTCDEEDMNSHTFTPGSWRLEPQSAALLGITDGTRDYDREATQKREELCVYLNRAGAVPWQKEVCPIVD